VIDPLKSFCGRSVDVPSIVEGVLLPWKTISEALCDYYDRHLYGKRTLQDLPETPTFVFNSTNLTTGVDFRFSKPYAGDYRIGLIERPSFRISVAVAASSAFPPVLSPVTITLDPKAFKKTQGADLYDNEKYRKELFLTDGGAYDNLGLETAWKRFDTLLVSDAGAPFSYGPDQGTDWLQQSLRVLDITTNQARGLRKRILIDLLTRRERKGTYWGIMTGISRYQLTDTLPVPPERTAALARIRTRLNPFTEAEQRSLINWGYAVCDAALRKWVEPAAPPPKGWPYPDFPLDRPLDPGVKVEATTDLVHPVSVPEGP
jgi:NTE family protein